jgi:hypothetical protein
MSHSLFVVFHGNDYVVIGGAEDTFLRFKLAALARADSLHVSLSIFAGLISCLDTAASTLYNDSNIFAEGLHLTKGRGGLFVLVNEVKLNDVLGLYNNIGGNSLLRVIIRFFSYK